MRVYICRWSNGDVSFVKAKNKDEAIYLLDEVGDAGHPEAVLEVANEFMLHLKMTGKQEESDDPEYEFEGFGEGLAEEIYGIGARSSTEIGSRYERAHDRIQAKGRPRTLRAVRGAIICALTERPVYVISVANTGLAQTRIVG